MSQNPATKLNKNGFSLIAVIIVVGIMILGGAGYLGITKFKAYQVEKAAKEKQAEELIIAQQKALEEAKKSIEVLKTQTQKELKKAKEQTLQVKEESEKLKTEVAQQLAENQRKLEEVQKQSVGPNLANIVKQWRPIIANIVCGYLYNGELYDQSGGSGTATMFNDGSVAIITNKHVIQNSLGYGPDVCVIKLPESDTIYQSYLTTVAKSGIDFGLVYVDGPDSYIKNLTSYTSQFPICAQGAGSVGDSVVILGYPAIGSASDITATEGIISGYENNYYITSAKIERGNSGGAAILIKDNCYLGPPTFVAVGTIESLGRILNVRVILGR